MQGLSTKLCVHTWFINEARGYHQQLLGDAFIWYKVQQVQQEDKLQFLEYKYHKQQITGKSHTLLSLHHREMTRK